MTLTRQMRHKARAEQARQDVIQRRRNEVEARVAPLREPGSRVEAHYLTLPVVTGTVIGTGRNGVTGTLNKDIIVFERDRQPEDFDWTNRRVSYHACYIFPGDES